MAKELKLNLNELNVESFTTSDKSVKGGYDTLRCPYSYDLEFCGSGRALTCHRKACTPE